MALYTKHCEYCDKKFKTSRKHAKTCSAKCKTLLWNKGFSNKKIMNLIAQFASGDDAAIFQKNLPHGYYNFAKEPSGNCYVYKYTEEYVKKLLENGKTFTPCRNVSEGDCVQ